MQQVIVIGLGYVGLTLAATLSAKGVVVLGIETNPAVASEIMGGRVPFYEEGLLDAVARAVSERRLVVVEEFPARPESDAVIFCVGTGLAADGQPDLANLCAVFEQVAPRLRQDTLAIVRSTVPVGATRARLYPLLQRYLTVPALAYCPERLIQGVGLREVVTLPQIVSGVDTPSRKRAAAFFRPLLPKVIEVSSLEVAELAKLANNAHTDMMYGFGNQLAMICECLDLQVNEVLSAANDEYPRPKLHGPGYVGGSCLTKDPYYLLQDSRLAGARLDLMRAARETNEALPWHIAEHFASALPAGATILLCGCAYKGRPATDDIRGSAAPILAQALRARGFQVLAQDFVAPPPMVERHVANCATWEKGARCAAGIVFLNDHPAYPTLSLAALLRAKRRPLIYDVWGVVKNLVKDTELQQGYHQLGNGAA